MNKEIMEITTKKGLLEFLKNGGKIKNITPNHKYFNLERKAIKCQSNGVYLENEKNPLGSWLAFSSIKSLENNHFSLKFERQDLGKITYQLIINQFKQ